MAKKGFDAMVAKGQKTDHITQWSFSRWSEWEKCPRKAYYKFVMKMKEPENKAMSRGTDIHKEGELALGQRKLVVPPSFKKVKKTLEKLHKLKALPELEFALNSAWKPASGEAKMKGGLGGWWSKDVWLRVKTDVLAFAAKGAVAGVIDWKSGRYKGESDSYNLQCHLYGTTVLSLFPKVEEVEAKLSFTDHGKEVVKIYTRDQLKEMRQGWEDRVRPMLSDRRFQPKPAHHCTWCAFSKGHGGPCKF